MKVLKWLTFIALFTVSLAFTTQSYDTTFEDSTSETLAYDESTVEYIASETPFDYHLGDEDSTSESTSAYQYLFQDSDSENAFETSAIKNLLYPPYDRDCPLHEHWEYCTGLCQRNCSNWSKALICPDICVQGCLCDWGFTRGPEGDCIPVSECPPIEDEKPIKINVQYKCKQNEHFSSCEGHEECQKNCSNYDREIPCVLTTCEPGCVCDEGFVRGRSGKCILTEQCQNPSTQSIFHSNKSLPKLCRNNEHFSGCNGLPMCQKSCSNYNESIICPLICVPGCVCDKGYVIGPAGECVPLEQCPFQIKSNSTQETFPICPKYEHYSSCSRSPECQRSCSNLNLSIRCSFTCVEGCVCDEGFVREHNNGCIPIEQCRKLNQIISIPDIFIPDSNQPQSSKSLRSKSKYYDMFPEVSPAVSESTKSQSSETWNLVFENANEEFFDTSSTTSEDIQPSTISPSDDNCPNELSCIRKCRLTGHSYGVCIGFHEEHCACF